jgi:hypothetical protein
MFQGKLELEQERCEKLKLELQREKQKGKELEIAVEKEKQLGQQKVEIEKEMIQELKREFLTLEGQRDSLSAQVMKIASAGFLKNRRTQQCWCSFLLCTPYTTCFGPIRWPSSGDTYTKYIKGNHCICQRIR